MKKFVAFVIAAMMMFTAQISLTYAKDVQDAVPIEQSKVFPKDIEKGLNYNGTVTISATVNTEGKVIKTVVMRSSGRPKIDKIAMEAASKWEFTPALNENGDPVEVWYMITFKATDF